MQWGILPGPRSQRRGISLTIRRYLHLDEGPMCAGPPLIHLSRIWRNQAAAFALDQQALNCGLRDGSSAGEKPSPSLTILHCNLVGKSGQAAISAACLPSWQALLLQPPISVSATFGQDRQHKTLRYSSPVAWRPLLLTNGQRSLLDYTTSSKWWSPAMTGFCDPLRAQVGFDSSGAVASPCFSHPIQSWFNAPCLSSLA